MPAVFGDFAELVVQRLDGVRGVDNAPDRWREAQERDEFFPAVPPGHHGRRVLSSELGVLEFIESVPGGFNGRGGVKGRATASGKPVSPSQHAISTSLTPRLASSAPDPGPESRSFADFDPDAHDVLDAFHVHVHGDVRLRGSGPGARLGP